MGEALAKEPRPGDAVAAGAAEKKGPPELPPGRWAATERRGSCPSARRCWRTWASGSTSPTTV
eukprot:5697158-Pyramimonas_sp.AAC.1